MKNKGLSFALLTTLISGVSVYANAQLVKGIDPIVHTTIKNGLVGVMVIGWILMTGQAKTLRHLKLSEWIKLLVVAVVGGSAAFALFFTGLKTTGAAEGALIQKTMVIWIAILAIPLLKEKVSWKVWAAAVLLYGVNFAGGFGFKTLGMAHLMVLIATLLWSVETIIVKKFLRTLQPDLLLAGRMGLGSGILAAYMGISGKTSLIAQISASQWLGMVFVSLLLFGYVMTWYRALRFAPAIHVSAILVGATVITTALTSLSGTLSFIQLIQSIVISAIVSGVVISLAQQTAAAPQHLPAC